MNLPTTQPPRQHTRVLVALPLAALVAGTMLRYGLFAAGSPGVGFDDYLRALCVHDCDWYEALASAGYDLAPSAQDAGDRANWAFFPLYPLLVAALGMLVGGDLLLAGFLLSSVAGVVAAFMGSRLLAGSLRAYGLFCVFLFIAPSGFYGSTLYTESLFMALTLAGFVALRQQRYVGAGLVGALLSATRVSGVFFSLAIALAALIEARQHSDTWRAALQRTLSRSDVVLGVFLAPFGLFAFMAFLYFHTGDALAFSHIQRGWGRELGNPLSHLWRAMVAPGHWISVERMWVASSVAGLALCAALVRRGQPAMALFCALSLMLPLVTGVMSMTRFALGLAPLWLCAVGMLAGNRCTTVLAACLLIAAGVLLFPGWLAASRYLM